MSKTYILSYTIHRPEEYEVKKPWWKFWVKPEIKTRINLVRHMVAIDQSTYDIIMKEPRLYISRLAELYGYEISNVMLEHGNQAAPYVQTNSNADSQSPHTDNSSVASVPGVWYFSSSDIGFENAGKVEVPKMQKGVGV